MKSKRTKLTKTLDTLWSKIVRFQGKNRCAVCGKTTSLNTHHIVGRRNHNLRWCLENGIVLCAGCHTFNRNSAHQNPIWFTNWLFDNRPEQLAYLVERVKEPAKPIKDTDLTDILKQLEEV